MQAASARPSVISRRDKHRLVTALARVLPPTCLLHDLEDLRPYECDGMAALRQLPLVVALPETEAQVVDILKICAEQGVPVVARGAGTGLSGGAQPHRFGLVLSLARFKKILQIDAHARRAVVQPGVRNLAISEAAAPTACITRPTLRRRSPARSAATWPRTPAACIASSTASRCTTCSRCAA
jgi:glycolate oxidase